MHTKLAGGTTVGTTWREICLLTNVFRTVSVGLTVWYGMKDN